jgi:hypothetical protein
MICLRHENGDRLKMYLLAHENDIDLSVNDFGDLKELFVEIFNRPPGPLSMKPLDSARPK